MSAHSPPPSEPRAGFRSLFMQSGAALRFAELPGSSSVRFTFSGRYAIYHSLRRMAGKRTTVLVPAFQCPTVVDPILHAGCDLRFYEIRPDLSVDRADFLSKLTPDVGAALFIRYFGLPSGVGDLLAICRDRGVFSIDDCSHSFLLANPLRLAQAGADVTVYSFKKIVPSLTGGGMLAPTQALDEVPRGRPPLKNSIGRLKRLADALRSSLPDAPPVPDFDSTEITDRLGAAIPAIRTSAQAAYPYDRALASAGIPLSSRIILRRAPLSDIVSKRRENYRILASAARNLPGLAPVAPLLPEDTCPWGFPVMVSQRAMHDYRLRALGVPFFTFGEILHPLLVQQGDPNVRMIETAQRLSDSLLVLSVHQDLDARRMQRYAQILVAYMNRYGRPNADVVQANAAAASPGQPR